MVLVTTFAASDASTPRGESNSGRNAITGAVADRVGMGDAAPGGMKLSGQVRDDLAKRKRAALNLGEKRKYGAIYADLRW